MRCPTQRIVEQSRIHGTPDSDVSHPKRQLRRRVLRNRLAGRHFGRGAREHQLPGPGTCCYGACYGAFAQRADCQVCRGGRLEGGKAEGCAACPTHFGKARCPPPFCTPCRAVVPPRASLPLLCCSTLRLTQDLPSLDYLPSCGLIFETQVCFWVVVGCRRTGAEALARAQMLSCF